MELLKSGSVALIFKIMGVLVGYIFFWILARYYSAEGVGIFQAIWTLLMIAAVIGKMGFDTSIVKFIGNYYGNAQKGLVKNLFRKVQFWLLLSAVTIALILWLFAEPLSFLFFETYEKQHYIYIAAISVIPLVLLNYHAETMKALKRILAFSAFQNGTIYLLIIVLIYAAWHSGIAFDRALWSLFIALAILALVSLWVLNRFIPPAASGKMPGMGYTNRQLFSITLPMLFSNSLFLLMNWTDTLMLSGFLPESEVGIYATALKIAALNSVILVAVNSIAMPKFAELYEKNDRLQFRRFVKQSTLLMLIVSLPVLLLIFVFPAWLLGIFGSEFTAGKNVLIILAIGQFFSTVSGSVINILNMSNHQKKARNILFFSTFINIILNLVLIPVYGILGAAVATASSTVLWNILSVTIIYRNLGFVTYPFIHIKKF